MTRYWPKMNEGSVCFKGFFSNYEIFCSFAGRAVGRFHLAPQVDMQTVEPVYVGN